jgi:hypothetical protein
MHHLATLVNSFWDLLAVPVAIRLERGLVRRRSGGTSALSKQRGGGGAIIRVRPRLMIPPPQSR